MTRAHHWKAREERNENLLFWYSCACNAGETWKTSSQNRTRTHVALTQPQPRTRARPHLFQLLVAIFDEISSHGHWQRRQKLATRQRKRCRFSDASRKTREKALKRTVVVDGIEELALAVDQDGHVLKKLRELD